MIRRFIPTLLAITLLGFILSRQLPDSNEGQKTPIGNATLRRRIHQLQREQRGLNLPLFYFSFGSLSDLPYSLANGNPAIRENFEHTAVDYGNPAAVSSYYHAIRTAIEQGDNSSLEALLYHPPSLLAVKATANQSIEAAWQMMNSSRERWKNYIPIIHFYGFNNQYHHWLVQILHGNFGRSYVDARPILEKIMERLPWSVLLSLLSILLAFAVSIPAGVFAATHPRTLTNRMLSIAIFLLIAIPPFFAGMMLLNAFSNPDHLNWFPTGGIGDMTLYNPAWNIGQKIVFWAPYLVLPLITYTYSGIAFLSRQVKAAMQQALRQDYILTALAKGLPLRKVEWKHAFRNALLPIITLFSSIFPFIISGSVIIEAIFSIPGMGQEIYHAILLHDYPEITAFFTIFAALTLISYWVADILYAIADPRIRL